MKYTMMVLIAILLGACSSNQAQPVASFQETLVKARDEIQKAHPEHEIYELNISFYNNDFTDYEVRFDSGTLGSQDINDSQRWSYDVQDFENTFEEWGSGTLYSVTPPQPIDVTLFQQEPAAIIKAALQATGIAEEAVNIDEYILTLLVSSHEFVSEELEVPSTQVWVALIRHRELENHVVAVDAQTGEVLFQRTN